MSADVGENAIDIALKVASALTSVGAEYFLGGSLASSLQGEPRATNDIDFIISLPVGRTTALRDALGSDFEVDTDGMDDAYLTSWASHLQLETLLQRARDARSTALPKLMLSHVTKTRF